MHRNRNLGTFYECIQTENYGLREYAQIQIQNMWMPADSHLPNIYEQSYSQIYGAFCE